MILLSCSKTSVEHLRECGCSFSQFLWGRHKLPFDGYKETQSPENRLQTRVVEVGAEVTGGGGGVDDPMY